MQGYSLSIFCYVAVSPICSIVVYPRKIISSRHRVTSDGVRSSQTNIAILDGGKLEINFRTKVTERWSRHFCRKHVKQTHIHFLLTRSSKAISTSWPRNVFAMSEKMKSLSIQNKGLSLALPHPHTSQLMLLRHQSPYLVYEIYWTCQWATSNDPYVKWRFRQCCIT